MLEYGSYEVGHTASSWRTITPNGSCASAGSAVEDSLCSRSLEPVGSAIGLIGVFVCAIHSRNKIMNAAQKHLIEKTLGVTGYLLLVVLCFSLFVGFADRGSRFIGVMLEGEDFAPIVWGLIVVVIASFWTRSFMRAGRVS